MIEVVNCSPTKPFTLCIILIFLIFAILRNRLLRDIDAFLSRSS